MRALVQRVLSATVSVDDQIIGTIGQGLLIFLGVTHDDCPVDLEYLVNKVAKLRIFNDQDGKMNRSTADVGGSILVVSQFTLYGDTRRGNRPGFDQAARPELAKPMYELFCDRLRQTGIPVATGQFAADMQIHLLNDGPVTLMIDSLDRTRSR
ncbi:MAG: D-aminoacyl-tRNA deacylase [Eubacteriales bacterium]|nr:D-aminoacyl-tRNA deacylase [Eubacteriales bacterium]